MARTKKKDPLPIDRDKVVREINRDAQDLGLMLAAWLDPEDDNELRFDDLATAASEIRRKQRRLREAA